MPPLPATVDTRRSRAPGASRVSASRKHSTGAVVAIAPVQQAAHFPVQPAGSGGAGTTRAPDAAATAAVRSVEWSSTTTTSSPGRSWGLSAASTAGSEPASSRAGMIDRAGRPHRCPRSSPQSPQQPAADGQAHGDKGQVEHEHRVDGIDDGGPPRDRTRSNAGMPGLTWGDDRDRRGAPTEAGAVARQRRDHRGRPRDSAPAASRSRCRVLVT